MQLRNFREKLLIFFNSAFVNIRYIINNYKEILETVFSEELGGGGVARGFWGAHDPHPTPCESYPLR